MPGPAKAPDAGGGRASEPVAEARTGRRLPTTLHYGGNCMREARDRIQVRRGVVKCPAPCAGTLRVAKRQPSTRSQIVGFPCARHAKK
jgi:hypothetical protein